MKKFIPLLLLILGLVLVPSVHAQFTTVSAQVKDSLGDIYQNCRGEADFVPSPTATTQPFLSGSLFQTSVVISQCDGNGNFTLVLADNNQVSDGHGAGMVSQWRFTICSSVAVANPPICFNYTATITGATQNLTSALSAVAPVLPGKTVPFSSITNGTNTSAAMLVGTGASLAPTGSGTITANSVSAMTFTNLTSGTNTIGAFLIGTGASLGTTGSGTLTATAMPYSGLSSFPAACGANLFSTQIAATPGCTQPAFSNLSGSAVVGQLPLTGTWAFGGTLSGNMTESGNNSYTGSDSFTFCPQLGNILCVDGGTYALTGVGINSALTAAGTREVWVAPPSAATNLSDAVITLNKGNRLVFFGNGVYTVLGITVPDSTTDTTATSMIDCPAHAKLFLATASNRTIIQDVNFLTLTGTANTFGTFKFSLHGCTLDGNKANQTALVTTGTGTISNVTRSAGGLVTINFSNTPSPAFSAGYSVNVAGVATDGFFFNGRFIVQSATATQITFNENQCIVASACHTTSLTTQPVAIAITGCTASGFTATCNTGSAHGFVPQQNVTMSGLTPAGYNGTFLLVTASGTSFTFVVPTSGLGASGTGTATPIITAIGYGGSAGIRIYGRRSVFSDVVIANNVCDGRWDEGVTPAAFGDDTTQLVSTYTDIQEMNSGCDGWVFWGPQSSVFTNVDDFKHGQWGIEAFQTLWGKGGTSYLNGSGGVHNFAADVQFTNRQDASAVGWGILTEPTASQMVMGAQSLSAPIGIEFRNPGNTFDGLILNSALGMKFNGGSVAALVNIFTVTTWFDCTNENALVILDVTYGSTGGTMQGTNCWTGQEMLRLPITAGNTTNAQFPSSLTGFHIGGWNPSFPANNGTLAELNFAQTWTANQSFNSGTLLPSAAGGTDLGSTALPFGNIWLGTAATNNFKFAPGATAAARTVSMIDPLANVNMVYDPSAGITANLIPKSAATSGLRAASSITDDGKNITSSEVAVLGNKVNLTSDFTDSTSGSLVLVTGLSYTLPTSKAVNVSFHCALLFDQATAAVVDEFGIGVTGTAPTQANASGTVYTAAGVETTGTLVALASTTPTSVVSFTPSAITTVWKAELDGTIEQPSNATPGVFSIYAFTTTGGDNLIVKRGSYCTLF